MGDWLVIVAVALIVALAAFYVARAKKRGQKCIGCPENCSGECHCCSHKDVDYQ